MNWKYVKPTSIKRIEEIEKKYNYTFPQDFKSLILKINNGRPELKSFDTKESIGHQFKKFLSFNPEDTENIYEVFESFYKNNKTLIPIADDPAGNYICYKGTELYYWQHETNEIEYITDSISTFIRSLY